MGDSTNADMSSGGMDKPSRQSGLSGASGMGGQSAQGLKDEARSFIDEAKTGAQNRVRSAAVRGKDSAVETLTGVAQSLVVASQQLQDRQSGAGHVISQIADRADRAAHYLDTADVEELVHRTERWARSNPALFLGGAFVIGILGARFLKSSRPVTGGEPARTGSNSPRFMDRQVPQPPVVADR